MPLKDGYKDSTDYKGWEWLGASGIVYELNKDAGTIELRIDKEVLGGLDAKTLKLYLYTEDNQSISAV